MYHQGYSIHGNAPYVYNGVEMLNISRDRKDKLDDPVRLDELV